MHCDINKAEYLDKERSYKILPKKLHCISSGLCNAIKEIPRNISSHGLQQALHNVLLFLVIENCRNNGQCVNRKGSFSCSCPSANITGKLCQFTEEICKGKCKAGETCYPKENTLGYECIANVQTVSMVYQLDSSQIPFKDWMIYDIAQSVENAISSRGTSEVCLCCFSFAWFGFGFICRG